MMHSFFGTCKKNEVNPYQWLRKVLELIPTYKVNRLAELLPQNLELLIPEYCKYLIIFIEIYDLVGKGDTNLLNEIKEI